MTAGRALKGINTALSAPKANVEGQRKHHDLSSHQLVVSASGSNTPAIKKTTNMQFTYVLLSVLGFVASVMALPA